MAKPSWDGELRSARPEIMEPCTTVRYLGTVVRFLTLPLLLDLIIGAMTFTRHTQDARPRRPTAPIFLSSYTSNCKHL